MLSLDCLLNSVDINSFETKSAVKSDAVMPMMSVTAKPRIGPVPFHRRMRPVMIVVMFESKIADRAFE